MLRLQEGQNFAEVGQESDYPKLKPNDVSVRLENLSSQALSFI